MGAIGFAQKIPETELLSGSTLPSASALQRAGDEEGALRVTYAVGRLSLNARAQPLRKVLAAIQTSSGVAIAVAPDVADVALTMRFDGVPLVDGLLSLLHDHNLVLSFAAGGAPQLRAASVHAKGRGPLSQPSPAPGQAITVAGDPSACEAPGATLDVADLGSALASPRRPPAPPRVAAKRRTAAAPARIHAAATRWR
jgi:hypothetical protein